MHEREPQTDGRADARRQVMREVNLAIFEIGSRFSVGSTDATNDLYTFFCECADPACYRMITLPLHRLDPTLSPGSVVLAHVPDVEQEPLT
jgi:hypothetical protein